MTPQSPDTTAAGLRPAVLITGAARRIGRAIALDLAKAGWSVGVHYHTAVEDACALIAEIEGLGGRAVPLGCDLMREPETASLVDQAGKALGPITLLINNASVFEHDCLETATRESWDLHMEVNLRAPFVLIQAFAAQLPAGASGLVINLLDQRVWNLTPHFTSYTVSKAAFWTLTQTLAMALAPRIRVNGIGPGPTLPSRRQTPEQFTRQWSNLPLARQVSPEEICRAVRFLLDAPSVTGQMIAVDSGQHLGWTRQMAGQRPED
jgi:NAD(P)-dependent dehydrogenase (short-subunit alcohol dehydrogenase family)